LTSPGDGPREAEPASRGGRLPFGGIPDERQIIARAKAGDKAALQFLCSSHWVGIYSMIDASVKSPSVSEELTQEVFERAIRSLAQFEYTGAPYSAYLTRIARNLVHDRWRSENRRSNARLEQVNAEVLNSPTPEEFAVSASEQELLRAALPGLSRSHRLVLYLRLIEGLSARETAKRMGRREDAIRQLQRRALESLRAEMDRIERE
jgi:RNA polymerase sigma-70 factor (ECF subfamily)